MANPSKQYATHTHEEDAQAELGDTEKAAHLPDIGRGITKAQLEGENGEVVLTVAAGTDTSHLKLASDGKVIIDSSRTKSEFRCKIR